MILLKSKLIIAISIIGGGIYDIWYLLMSGYALHNFDHVIVIMSIMIIMNAVTS